MAENHHKEHGRMTQAVVGGLVGQLLTGVVGSMILHAGLRAAPSAGRTARQLAVAAAAQGIVLFRRLQAMAEEARLASEDIMAEARQRVGEEAPPPAAEEHVAEEHGHRH